MNDMSDLTSLKTNEFLGSEFLTWLLAKSEINSGDFELPGIGEFNLLFDNKLTLSVEDETSTFKGEILSLEEARFALQKGKKVKEARLRFDIGDDNYFLTLNSETLQFKSVKIPGKFSPDEEECFYERTDTLQTVTNIIDGLLLHFVELRISDSWDNELNQIQEWVEE